MQGYRETTGRDWAVTGLRVVVFVAVVAAGAYFLLPTYWYVWAALVLGGLLLLVSWHARAFAYRCPECASEFEVSALVDFVSPQGVGRDEQGRVLGWKLLRCPVCRRFRRALVVRPEGR